MTDMNQERIDPRKLTQWIRISEAAKLVGVNRKTLMRACEEGKLGDNAKQMYNGYWYVKESWVIETGRIGPPGA
jgi:predicted site-specific integrase-resolvase